MSLLRRTAYGFGWNHLGRVGEYLLLYAISIIIARNLGPELNGICSLALSLVHLLLIVTAFGFETSLAASLSQLLNDNKLPVVCGIIRGLLLIRGLAIAIFGVACLGFQEEISSLLNAPPLLVRYFSTILLYFLFRGLSSLLVGVLIALMETRTSAVIGICCRVVELLGVIVLTEQGYGLGEILMLLAVSQCAQTLLIAITIRGFLLGPADSSGLVAILRTGSRFWLNGMVEFLLGRQADVLLLGYFLVGTFAIGQYDVALSFSQLINFGMTTGLTGISIASFSALAGQRADLVPEYWESLVRYVILAVVPVFVVCVAFAGDLLPALYGPAYTDSVPLFQVIACFLIITRIIGGGISADYLYATGNTAVLLKSSTVSGLANLALALVLIPRMGPMGAVLSTGTAAVTVAAFHMFYVQRYLHVQLPVTSGILVLAAGLVTALAVKQVGSLASWNNVWNIVLVSPPAFLIFCYIAKPLTDRDVDVMRRLSPLLGNVANLFARVRLEGKAAVLTDRQKVAYAWMPTSDVVVDVGSSNTPLGDVLSEKGNHIVVLDTDINSIRALSTGRPHLKAVAGTAEHLPIPSDSVDTLLLLDVLEHVRNERVVIAEIHRVLKANGICILSVPHAGAFSFLDPLNLRARLNGALAAETVHRHYTEADLRALLEPRFRIVRRHRGGSFVYPVTFWANNFFSRHLGVEWGRFFKRLGDLDNDISWGGLSYNIIIMAEKVS